MCMILTKMCPFFLFLQGCWEKERPYLTSMAPHPVVQAVIDLSAGAIGNIN